jgi:hypothetical protein
MDAVEGGADRRGGDAKPVTLHGMGELLERYTVLQGKARNDRGIRHENVEHGIGALAFRNISPGEPSGL